TIRVGTESPGSPKEADAGPPPRSAFPQSVRWDRSCSRRDASVCHAVASPSPRRCYDGAPWAFGLVTTCRGIMTPSHFCEGNGFEHGKPTPQCSQGHQLSRPRNARHRPDRLGFHGPDHYRAPDRPGGRADEIVRILSARAAVDANPVWFAEAAGL